MKLGVAFIVALALLGVVGAGCAKAEPGDTSESIAVNGVHRTYVLHVPDGITGRVPLILSFHGHGGDGAQQSRLTGFDALSDRYRFIIAYPDGIDRSWNDGRPVNANGPDDLAFAAALADELEQRYSIDPARVYATGFSNGAVFSNYLACNQANRFAAVAPVSGPMPVVDAPNCHPQRAVPVLEIGGTTDPVVPFDGGPIMLAGTNRGEVLSFAQTGAFWAKNAGCAASPAVTPLPAIAPPDGTSVTRTSFSGCHAGAGVVEYAVVGGGHAWPGGPQYLPKFLVGTASRQLDASETIVQFFLAHPKR
jgi:polyhydroxybutyrate depolymerase